MSTHCGYVVKVEKLKKHPNADRLQIAEFFGNEVCVGLDVVQGEIGIYFPSDLQLSLDFCLHNNLLRKLPDGNPGPGYLDLDKRNIKAINLRGAKSDGIYCSLDCIVYTGVNLDDLNIGDTITVVNGKEICCKYIPKGKVHAGSSGNRTRKKKVNIAPTFAEHADTEQLAYNLSAFRSGDEIEITLKMHGTSQRTGYLPVFKGYKKTLLDRIFRRDGTPIYDWGYVSGTRRTILDDYDGGFYGSNAFRESHAKMFEGKLWKGETVYYEVVGFTDTGAPIMGSCGNDKLGKDFVKQYGKETVFSYGCTPNTNALPEGYTDESGKFHEAGEVPQSDIYVYRMTMTNEDGNVVEYTPDFMRYRCDQMGVKYVPVLWSGDIPQNPGSKNDPTITAGEWIQNVAEMYYDGPDPVGKTHVREGVVVRIVNRPKFSAYKHKNFEFKVLSGIAVANVEAAGADVSEDILAEM